MIPPTANLTSSLAIFDLITTSVLEVITFKLLEPFIRSNPGSSILTLSLSVSVSMLVNFPVDGVVSPIVVSLIVTPSIC